MEAPELQARAFWRTTLTYLQITLPLRKTREITRIRHFSSEKAPHVGANLTRTGLGHCGGIVQLLLLAHYGKTVEGDPSWVASWVAGQDAAAIAFLKLK